MDNMNYLQQSEHDLPLVDRDGKKYIDSRTIAEALQIDHGNLMEGIRKYQSTIEEQFGKFPFETGKPQNNENGGGRPTVYALLTEDQALFVGTLSRNTSKVVEFKYKLVQTFQKARKLAQQIAKELTRKDLALMILKSEEELEQAKQIIQEQQPKVQAYNALMDCDGNCSLEETAKAIGMGRNRMTEKLREKQIFYKKYANGDNHVYQDFIDRGYFKVKIKVVDKGHGLTVPYPMIFATPKGIEWLKLKVFSQNVAEV